MAEFHRDSPFGWWVTGLIDGEGCFYAELLRRAKKAPNGSVHQCVELQIEMAVALREDDYAVLEKLRGYFDCGKIYHKKSAVTCPSSRLLGIKGMPQKKFVIRRPEELLSAVLPHFERFPLQSKKSQDFVRWRSILEFANAGLFGAKGWLRRFPDKVERLQSMCTDLKSSRKFKVALQGVN